MEKMWIENLFDVNEVPYEVVNIMGGGYSQINVKRWTAPPLQLIFNKDELVEYRCGRNKYSVFQNTRIRVADGIVHITGVEDDRIVERGYPYEG